MGSPKYTLNLGGKKVRVGSRTVTGAKLAKFATKKASPAGKQAQRFVSTVGEPPAAYSAMGPAAFHQKIIAGLPIRSIPLTAAVLGIPAEELAGRVGFKRATYYRLLKARRTMSAPESDAVARYQELFRQATETFDGDGGAARNWLSTAQPGLGNQVPLEFARSTVGCREVEKLLTRIDHGVYA